MYDIHTPRVFVSATSSDLSVARRLVNEGLTRIECLPVEDSVFGTEYGPIHQMIKRKIEGCSAVIHLVGRDYGGEPNLATIPPGKGAALGLRSNTTLPSKLKRSSLLPFAPLSSHTICQTGLNWMTKIDCNVSTAPQCWKMRGSGTKFATLKNWQSSFQELSCQWMKFGMRSNGNLGITNSFQPQFLHVSF